MKNNSLSLLTKAGRRECSGQQQSALLIPGRILSGFVTKLFSRSGKWLMAIVVAGTLGACAQTQNLVAGDKMAGDLAINEVQLGAGKGQALATAQTLWQSESVCDISKTGVGINKRAYFLETCVFSNPEAQTVCDLSPESIEYAFLEGDLVQVMYRFAEADEANYASCIEQQAMANGFSLVTTPRATDNATDIEDTKRTRLLDADETTGITVGEAREVRVYNATLAPTVHKLQNQL